ncbi:MAG: signal peptidase II [Propionibacterium sp.]|nr:signal peptidase II [Propionibacterium sp.]
MAAILVTVDQITKQWALDALEPGRSQPFLGEWLKLRLVFNPGAAFSLGADSTWIFTILAGAVTLFVLIFLTPRVRHLGWALGFGLLLAGVVGNLIDRIFRDPAPGRGHVIDFLELPNWPIFNVADISIVAAAILIIALSLFTRATWDGTTPQEERRSSKPAASKPASDDAEADAVEDRRSSRPSASKPASDAAEDRRLSRPAGRAVSKPDPDADEADERGLSRSAERAVSKPRPDDAPNPDTAPDDEARA